MNRAALLASATLIVLAAGPVLAAPAGEETVHVVEQGETLGGIANRAGVSADAIAKANGLEAPFIVRIGQKLSIPRSDMTASSANAEGSYTVKTGETLGGIANRTGVSVRAIAAANDLSEPYLVRVGQTLKIPRGKASVKSAARLVPAAGKTAPAPITGGDPASETLHVVAPGETLGGIAQRAQVPRVLIAEANGLAPPYVVKVGQRLQIPRTRRHTVAAGETGFAVSYRYAVPWEQIAVANGLDPHAPLQTGQSLLIPTVLNPPATSTPVSGPAPATAPTSAPAKSSRFLWPVSGDVRRGYATGSDYHDGLDIQAPKGTMVRAAAAGTVKFAGKEKDQFGNLVVIDHGDGWFTAYGFLSRVTVKQGAKVAAGERVGLVGSTGLAKGNELHFEVRRDGKPIDPLDELPKAP